MFLVLGAVLTVTPVAQVLLAKFVVDSLADQAATAAFTFAVLYILTLLVPAGAAPIQRALTSWLEARAVAEVDYSLIDNSARLVDLDHIEQPAYQDEVQLLRENAYFPPRLFHHMQGWLGRLLSLVGMLVLLISLHPLIPLALGVSGGLSLMARRRHNIDVWAAMRNRTRAMREMQYCTSSYNTVGCGERGAHIRLGDFFLGRFRRRSALVLADVTRLHLVHLRKSALLSGLSALALAGGFWYVAVPGRRRSTHPRRHRPLRQRRHSGPRSLLSGLFTGPATFTKRTYACARSSGLPTKPSRRSSWPARGKGARLPTPAATISSCAT